MFGWFSEVKRDAKSINKHWPSKDCFGPDDDNVWWISEEVEEDSRGKFQRCRCCNKKHRVKEPMFAGKCGMTWADER